MYLLIASDGQLSLQDIDNMQAFAIIEEKSGSARTSLGDIAAAAEDNHYWIDAVAGAVILIAGWFAAIRITALYEQVKLKRQLRHSSA